MKASAIVSAVVASSLGLGSVSVFAQDHDWRGRGGERRAEHSEQREDRQAQRQEWRGQQQQQRFAQPGYQQPDYQRGYRAPQAAYQQPQYQQPQYQQRYQQPQYQARAYQNQPAYRTEYQRHYRNAPYYAPRGAYAGASRYYYVGDRLPHEYWRGMRVVSDWPQYSLYQPPYGYQWVQADSGEFILVALATGIIASLLLN
ncbi:RcnB family protein [Ramlibacter sp.]|uniref:RcnB family protein n=1 Tax=Ramlibacter sp. TaxID=1917967 RepID=UPI001803C8FC|nr:RcnB family protein [Ramlibacter sp.]MBA2674734.1 RcnB family protein [Ramlibacter sp.]